MYMGDRSQSQNESELIEASHHDMLSCILGRFHFELLFLFNELVSVCIHMKLTYLELSCFLNSKRAAMKSILYSYKHGFSGFAAVLTHSQAKLIAGISLFNTYDSKSMS